MSIPKVSIIVPVFNTSEIMQKCLMSLDNQTLDDIEVLIVDDGSTDKSAEVIRSYIKRNDKFTYLYKENGGLSDARNYGINYAKGDYILFVDSDDYITQDAAEKLYQIANQNNLDILRSSYIKIDSSGNQNYITEEAISENIVLKGHEYLKIILEKEQLQVVAWKSLYKRSFLDINNLRFPKGLLHEDELWTPTVLLQAERVMYVDLNFYYYQFTPGSITNKKNKSKNGSDVIQICHLLSERYSQVLDKDLKKALYNMLAENLFMPLLWGNCTNKKI